MKMIEVKNLAALIGKVRAGLPEALHKVAKAKRMQYTCGALTINLTDTGDLEFKYSAGAVDPHRVYGEPAPLNDSMKESSDSIRRDWHPYYLGNDTDEQLVAENDDLNWSHGLYDAYRNIKITDVVEATLNSGAFKERAIALASNNKFSGDYSAEDISLAMKFLGIPETRIQTQAVLP